jgi:hypothetical protein
MICSFHVGLTDSVMQRMQLFFCQYLCVKIILISVKGIVKIANMLPQKMSIKRCYFQFNKRTGQI